MMTKRRRKAFLPGYLLLHLFVLLFAQVAGAIEKTTTFIRIDSASASSVAKISEAGGKQYAAVNALSRGSKMWCSAGGHSPTQEVQWEGSIVNPRLVRGVKINWGYAPGEYMVETSFDGEKFTPAIGWKKTVKTEQAFAEDVLFPQSLKMRSVRIRMRGPRHGYFGINFIALISDSKTLVLLTSGITSPDGEMCLQTESGKTAEGTAVVLDTCIMAIAAGDGREIFRFTDTGEIVHVVSQLCVTLKDNSEHNGGEIIIARCKKFTDGRSNWEIQPDGQLKVMRKGNFCLSQDGSRAGNADMALEKMTYTNFARAGDKLHTAQKAFDGNPETYFATQDFDSGALPETVDLKVDLGAEFKVLRSEIDWMYPASRYNILHSTDGSTYNLTSSTIANSMNSTINDLQGSLARYIQLQMTEPHPTYSIHEGKAVYGALKSNDARDKYFVMFVSEFDQQSGASVTLRGKRYLTATSKLETLGTTVEEKRDDMDNCYKNLQTKSERLRADRAELGAMKQKFEMAKIAFDDVVTEEQELFTKKTVSGKEEGIPEELPEDCTDILFGDPTKTDGFYDILPACAPGPLRVYCDMKTHSGLHVYHGLPPLVPGTILTRDLFRPEEVLKRCQELDLKPFVMTKTEQAFRVQTILKHMKFQTKNSTNAIFPIGVVKPNGVVTALDLNSDISAIVSAVPKPSNSLTSIGLGWHAEAFSYFDWKTSEIDGALCEVNESPLLKNKIIELECQEVPRNNHKFEGCPFTWVMSRCPKNCNQTELNVVYGLDTYRDDSPLCLAATQADGIGKHGLVNVTFMPGMGSYEGGRKNGIHSRPYTGAVWDRSFRVTKPSRSCPNKNKSPSFLQLTRPNGSKDSLSLFKLPENRNTDTASQMRFLQNSEREPAISSKSESVPEMKDVKDSTEDAANLVLRFIERVGGVSPELTKNIAEKAFETLSWSRSLIKPSEELDKKVKAESVVLDSEGTSAVKKMFSIESKVLDALTDYDSRLQKIRNQKAKLWGFKTFLPPNLMELLSPAFWKFFDRVEPPVTDPSIISPSVTGHKLVQGSWFMATSVAAMVGREGFGVFAYLDEDSQRFNKSVPVTSRQPLAIQNKGVFDGILTFDFYVEKGTGSFAVAFRMRDEQNMYIYEVRQEQGIKRLLKVVDGRPIELATRSDGGYLNSVWYTLRIELAMNKIDIQSGISGQPLKNIFNLLDGSHVTGTVAFLTIGVDMYIDRLSFTANRCAENYSPPAPPLPPLCSIFQHKEVSNFDEQWHAVQPPKTQVQGIWDFKRDVSGRANVLVQYVAVTGTDNQHGTMAADFFPQCDGLVGLIIHYGGPQMFVIAEFGPDLVRIRRMGEDGEFTDLASITKAINANAKYNIGEWNSASLNFTSERIGVTLNNKPIMETTLTNITLPAGGRVGLSAWRCGGVGFDRVSLHPTVLAAVDLLEESKTQNTSQAPAAESPAARTPGNPFIFTEKGVINSATNSAIFSCHAPHILARKSECEKILGNETISQLSLFQCQYNYCDVCCSKSVTPIIEARRLSEDMPQTHFQWEMFREEISSLQSRCLLECAKSNHGALASSDLLASATKTCSAASLRTNEKATRRSTRGDFLAAWEALDALEADQNGKAIESKCQDCCSQETEGDVRVNEACKAHCVKGKDSLDWKLFEQAITIAQM